MRRLTILLIGLFLISIGCVANSSSPDSTERAISYQYTCDFLMYNVQGKFQSKMRIEAVHTRGLPGDMMLWNQASIAFGTSLDGEFNPPMKQPYMENFSYPVTQIKNMLTGEFYKGFPVTPIGFMMRNTVVDVHTFDVFTPFIDKLKLNQTTRCISNTMNMVLFENQGNQSLKNLDLTWTGNSQMNGNLCKVIHFQSSLDSVKVNLPESNFNIDGSTVFWGDIWVTPGNKQIEYATLHEHSLFGSPDPEAKIKDVHSIYRTVTLQKINDTKPEN